VAQSNGAYWITILEQEQPYADSRIEAHVDGNLVVVATQNVRQLQVTLSEHLLSPGRVTVWIDEKSWMVDFRATRQLTFSKRAGEFRRGANDPTGLHKTRDLYGPIRQAAFAPFVLVYGTIGDPSATKLLLHEAGLEAFRWWRRANGFVEVLPDSEITRAVISNYNLVLFGGPGENSITSRINRHLPIRQADGCILLDGSRIDGPGVAAKFVYPNPLNPERLIVVHEGSDLQGLRLSDFFRGTYAGAGLPDFIVFDNDVRTLGWGGVIAAGFFDSRWKLDETLMYRKSGH
jgi:hypothetical protein